MTYSADCPVRERESLAAVSDDDLMRLVDLGELDGPMAVIRRRYASRVRRVVMRIVGDRHVAEDVAQEVFSRVFLKSHLYRGGSSFRAWLFGIAHNQALTAVRDERRRRNAGGWQRIACGGGEEFDLEQVRDGHHDDRRPEEREFMAAFVREVDRLPARYREVFQRCVVEGHPYREVADELGMPIGTVAIRIMRARKQLFGLLSPHLDRLRRPPVCV